MMPWLMAALIAGCGHPTPAIKIGSKDFTEQLILGHLVSRLVTERLPDAPVKRRLNLGGTLVAFSALTPGDIDVYPEYTGTILTTILKESPPPIPADAYRRVRREVERRFDIVCLPPLGFNNTYALMMRSQYARELKVSRIEDLRGHDDRLTAGFTSEFLERQDGYRGLRAAYGLTFARPPRQMAPGLMYQAVHSDQVQVISGFSTDGRIAAYDLTVLRDNRRFFPPYQACLLVRRDALARWSGLEGALRELSGGLDDHSMRELNAAVDLDKKSPRRIAAAWQRQRQLIK